MSRKPPPRRDEYAFHTPIATRWMDNDVYGHVNNVMFYSFFDTAIAHLLLQEGGLDPWRDPVIGFCVESGCRFHAPVAFPTHLTAGVRVVHLGTSSVRYEVAIFGGSADTAAADGHFVHVFVDRESQKPTKIPEKLHSALLRFQSPADGIPVDKNVKSD